MGQQVEDKTITHILGYPRVGGHRELKFAQEKYWLGDIDQTELKMFGICSIKPMTIDWISYSQLLTTKRMKGMLTGPVTIFLVDILITL